VQSARPALTRVPGLIDPSPVASVHLVLGIAVMAINLAAGLWGAWHWYRFEPSPVFWVLARAGQAALLAQVLLGGLLLALGESNDGLHYLYGLLPVVVSVIAEQLRIVSAEHVLQLRNLESAQDVAKLPEDEQRSVVLQIVRREMGIMTLSAIAIAALALRAGFTSGGF
jgi:hypothetical protein